MGRAAMLMYMWEKHWIMGAGALIKGVISKCVICRKYRAKSAEQKMAALPSERVLSDNPVFYNTGLDMFGRFQVKQGRSQVKRYGLLFTCLATRAIHLEIVHTANADSCLNAIRRFVCMRGLISSIRTDNGTNFVAASNELSKAMETWNRSQIPQWLAQHGIRWEFNPPGASHFGVVWERLIRVVRQVMNGVLKEQHLRLDDEGLCTFFCEVEHIVNGRPITTVSSDADDLRPLTPNMILTMNEKSVLPPRVFDKTDMYVRRRWRQIQYSANLYWTRWRKEYLPLMQKRQNGCIRREICKKGDIVLIVDDLLPRSTWLFGRVIETKADSRGLVRSCRVKTQHSTLERPIILNCVC
ncbi:uncharacterized protein LOC117108579 [Anneissia japonica]|uniref:uncharacterized protein LOC117108579 n=1 Tax=Anneissia japonica TaxID=1529436 RepID=UPI0014254ED9|nr:uncharacterized protein LOC117108579 [Anneissia japonica]